MASGYHYLFSALSSSSVYHISSAGFSHSFQKPVCSSSFSFFRLIS